MTLILDTKLNKYMIDIIREYLLPVIDINNKLIREIRDETYIIMYYIDNNYCIDNYGCRHNTLINSKIVKDTSRLRKHDQWTIRYEN